MAFKQSAHVTRFSGVIFSRFFNLICIKAKIVCLPLTFGDDNKVAKERERYRRTRQGAREKRAKGESELSEHGLTSITVLTDNKNAFWASQKNMF